MSNILPFPRADEPQTPSITDLPFVKDTPEGRRFWCVDPSDEADNETGRRYARLALAYAVEDDMSPLIGWAIRDMPAHHGPVEIGFIEVLVRYSIEMHRAKKRFESC